MADSVQMCILFQSLKSKATRLLDPLAQAEGLTQLQACMLLHLYRRTATVGDISELTGMGQANTSALCKKLEQEGFLVRTRSETDRRVVTLSLTEKGQAAMERFRQGMDHYLTMLDELPQHMKDDLVRGVEAADKALDYLYEQGE